MKPCKALRVASIHFNPLGHSSDSWGTLHAGCDDPAGRRSRQTSAAIFTMKAEPQKDSEQDGTGMAKATSGKAPAGFPFKIKYLEHIRKWQLLLAKIGQATNRLDDTTKGNNHRNLSNLCLVPSLLHSKSSAQKQRNRSVITT